MKVSVLALVLVLVESVVVPVVQADEDYADAFKDDEEFESLEKELVALEDPYDNLIYEHYPDIILGKVHEPFNFTIRIFKKYHRESTATKHLNILWDSNSAFIHPSKGNVTLDEDGNGTVTLTSTLLGIYFINFYTPKERKTPIESQNKLLQQRKELENAVEVAVERRDQLINKVVNLGFAVALTVAIFFLGIDIDLHIILETVKRPVGPFVGMLCQFGLMPGLAYTFGYIFLTTKYERLGLLLLGCSPGGAFSNAMTTLFGGDLNLSVTMTFFSTVVSFAMTTFWVWLLGRPLVAGHIEIPYIRMGISLASFTAPALLGVWFKHKKPLAAEKVKEMVSRPFYIFVLVLTPFAVGATNWFFFYLVSWRHIASGTLLALCGYVFGGVLAIICCQKRAQVIAISMETAIQNVGIPLISLNLTFQSPYSDMGILPIISYFFFSTGPIMFLIYGCYTITSKVCGLKHNEKKNSGMAVDQCTAGENLLLTSDVDGDKAVEELLAKDSGDVPSIEVKLVPVQSNGTKEKLRLDKSTSTNNLDPEIVFIPVTPDTTRGGLKIPGPV